MGVGGHSFEGLWGPPALGLLLLQPHEQSYMCMCSPCRQAWVQQHASWMLLCGVGWGLVKKKVCPEIACAPLSKAPSLSREATEKLSNAWMQDVAASVCGPMYMCIHIHIGPPCDKQLHVHLVVYAVNLAQTLPANQIPLCTPCGSGMKTGGAWRCMAGSMCRVSGQMVWCSHGTWSFTTGMLS